VVYDKGEGGRGWSSVNREEEAICRREDVHRIVVEEANAMFVVDVQFNDRGVSGIRQKWGSGGVAWPEGSGR